MAHEKEGRERKPERCPSGKVGTSGEQRVIANEKGEHNKHDDRGDFSTRESI